MFERYTERARRAIFFSRYEASQFGATYIEAEHLLLGIMREDATLRVQLERKPSGSDAIRRLIEQRTPPTGRKVSTSVDMPLSAESKLILARATEECESLGQKWIDSGHLVLALLHGRENFCAHVLRDSGIQYHRYRQLVAGAHPSPSQRQIVRDPRPAGWVEDAVESPAAESLNPAVRRLRELLLMAGEHVKADSEHYALGKLARTSAAGSPWSRKQALGHLVDLAAVHQLWFARALSEPRLTGLLPADEQWAVTQRFEDFSWTQLVDLWFLQNRLLLHVLTIFPESKLGMSCRVGVAEPVTFLRLVQSYVEGVDDILGQILSLL